MKKRAQDGGARSALDQAGREQFPCLFGLHDIATLDTTPGANSPLAPRAGWAPSADEYIDALRAYCRSPCGPRQLLTGLARRMALHGDQVPMIVGPYADQVAGILAAFVAVNRDARSMQAEAKKGSRCAPGVRGVRP